MKQKKSKKIIYFAVAFLVILGAVVFFITQAIPVDELRTAAWINGEPIAAGEFQSELSKNYSSVLSNAVTAGGIQGKGFWETEISGIGKTPLTMLTEAALKSAVRRKVIQLWAREAGLEQDISYSAFLKKFNEENRRRVKNKQEGIPVYGPDQYTKTVYSDLQLAETEYNLRNYLTNRMVFDEDELKRLYETEYKPRYYHPGSTTLDYAVIYKDEENAGQKAENLRRAVAGGVEMKEAAQRFGANYHNQGINLLRMPGMGLPYLMQEAAWILEQGEVSQVYEDEDSYWIFKCIEREPEKYPDFDDTKQKIMHDIMIIDFEKELDERMSGEIKVNSRIIKNLTRGSLPG